MAEISASIRDGQDAAIEEQLEYGYSKSQWLREAIDLRLGLENADELIAEGSPDGGLKGAE